MINKSYICYTKTDWIDCQKYLFKKGYKWNILNIYLASNTNDYNRKIRYIIDNDDFVFPLVIHTHFDFLTLGWDRYFCIKDEKYNFEIYSSREKKLKRILNEDTL